MTSRQSAELFTTPVYDGLSPEAPVFPSLVCFLVGFGLCLPSAPFEEPVTSTLAKSICQVCVYGELGLP